MNNVKIKCKNCDELFIKVSRRKYCDKCKQIPNLGQKIWVSNNREKSREKQRVYRKQNLELCRKRTRVNQISLNNRKRFGGNRDVVLERDNYLCQICGKDVSKKYQACVHHKNRNKQDNSFNNLITLCKKCHTGLHYNEDKKILKFQFNSKQLKQIWKEQGKKLD